ncbi:MAG: class C beta-lactamase-related serine hydrolase [Sphingobacteriales bacterium]|jgi:D-alanyl-D-alanine carboxypeptidase|nr:MAG: class C beta-lactamase-related serine hydrolase [Sphingobacteriales bacterium]
MKRTILFLCLLITLGATAQDLRRMADSVRLRRRVPALVYAVLSADSILTVGGVGYKVFRTKDTIQLNSRFHIGTATASLTSYIAAHLVAKGKILYNTTIEKSFPSFAAKCRAEYRGITLADCLSQRAGFKVFNNYIDFSTLPNLGGTPIQSRQRFVEWIVQQKNSKDTVAKRNYQFTNANTAVAAAMLEKAAGKPWEELLQEYINTPLGLTIKTEWPNRVAATEPWGHWMEGGDNFRSLDPQYWFRVPGYFTGAADANVSIIDYAKFIQDHLKGLQAQKAKLPNRAYELMHYGYKDYAFGWTNLQVNNLHISESDGTVGSFYSHVAVIKEKNIAVIVMCNSGDNAAKGACLNLARLLRQVYIK